MATLTPTPALPPPARPEATHKGFDRRWLILGVTTIGGFMTLLDTTMVNIGLHTIMDEYGANVQDGQWVVTAYTLALSVVIPISGWMAERVGLKRLYMITMAAFIVGSVLCGLAWDLPSLVFFRVLQGVGGGMLQPLGMATVYSVVTPLERPKFMAMLGLPQLVGPLLGPSFGGYLVQFVDWRAMFTINLPIGLIGLVLAWRILTPAKPRGEARLDIPGFLLSTAAFPSVLLGLTMGSRNGWTQWDTLGFLGFGAACFAAWVWVELRQPDPMLDLRLFKNPIFRLSMGLNTVLILALFGTQFLMPLFLQGVLGLGPLDSGMMLIPQGLFSFASMNLSGRLYNRVGPRPLIMFGTGVMVLTTWALSRFDAGSPVWLIAVMVSARGFAMGFCMMPNQTAAYNTVPQGGLARATALANGLQRFLSSGASALLGTVLNLRTLAHAAAMGAGAAVIAGGSEAAPVRASAEAFSDTFLLLTAASAIGCLLAVFHRDPVLQAKWAEEKAAGPRPATAND